MTKLHQWISSRKVSFITLVLVGLFFVYDIYRDVINEKADAHIYLELLIFFLILLRLAYELKSSLQLSRALGEEKTKTANLSGQLSDYITEQFKIWNLSHSEVDIAWLMLKGYTFQEIAEYRGVKEKTVRQQASSIYRKSGNKNRNEFNSFFYEELMGGMEG